MTDLTPQEKSIVDIVRLNKATPRLEIRRELRIGRLNIVYTRRSSRNLWGRFGGGWNWKLGIAIGGTTVIVDLLVAYVRFSWSKTAHG